MSKIKIPKLYSEHGEWVLTFSVNRKGFVDLTLASVDSVLSYVLDRRSVHNYFAMLQTEFTDFVRSRMFPTLVTDGHLQISCSVVDDWGVITIMYGYEEIVFPVLHSVNHDLHAVNNDHSLLYYSGLIARATENTTDELLEHGLNIVEKVVTPTPGHNISLPILIVLVFLEAFILTHS